MTPIDETAVNLPWQKFDYREEMLSCPHCDKSFRDERARKNHIKCVHVNSDGADDSNNKKLLVCELCSYLNVNGQTRTFPNEEALTAHKRAKHSSCETPIEACIIVPDTDLDNDLNVNAKGKGEISAADGEASVFLYKEPLAINLNFGKCTVCGLGFTSKEAKQRHFEEFVPIFKSSPETSSYACFNCGKRFVQERSLIQHRLVCSVVKQSEIER
eukprot:CAMPEP_0204615336 /NCGR_PEP_ID=MMETSP0717-20131115/2850_1 /ASSEMBLY_ACC=CAM_ASM_000666 /TAXON_ID=230516 /ORGANISM="Chaetoceros curvisetus" /LENGTH=214 /DNA_ID=CAMNT_0051628247 /DNA_START=433 /DNA_END=1077 /DNA_ORIENTATION=-